MGIVGQFLPGDSLQVEYNILSLHDKRSITALHKSCMLPYPLAHARTDDIGSHFVSSGIFQACDG